MRATPIQWIALFVLSLCLTAAHAISTQEFKAAITAQLPGTPLADHFDELIESAVVTKIGDGSRKVILFADPYCNYCAKLQKNFAYVDNVTIYTLMFSLDKSQSKGTRAIASIWCSTNSDAALKSWFAQKSKKVFYESDACAPPLELMAEAASSLNVIATPTIIFSDGRVKSGLMSPYVLEDNLGE